jgi:hypothetical protein
LLRELRGAPAIRAVVRDRREDGNGKSENGEYMLKDSHFAAWK